jgi:hypothetical protein
MRKHFRLLVLVVIPLFLVRLIDTYNNVNLTTGFFDSGGWIPRAAMIVVIASVTFVVYLKTRQSWLFFSGPHHSLVCSVFFGFAGILVFFASLLQLIKTLSQIQFEHLFLSRQQLGLLGYSSGHFRFDFYCALVGISSTVWFLWASVQFFSNRGNLSGKPFLSCLPILWYCLRAITDFSVAPVNPHNTLLLTYLATSLTLGLFYLRYARFVSLGHLRDDAVRLAACATLAFLVTLSFKAPLLAILPQDSADVLTTLADCFAAAAAYVAADLTLKGDGAYAQSSAAV